MNAIFKAGAAVKKRLYCSLLLACTLMFPAVLAASPVSLEELLQKTGAVMHWDPLCHTGSLSREGKYLVFRAGDPWMVLNGSELLVTGTVLEERGRLIFSEEAADTVFEVFGVDSDFALPYTLNTILIDPGHGGKDSGAGRVWAVDGVNQPLLEKDVVLEISLRLAEALRKAYPEKTVLLTRKSDVYPTLEERVELANNVELGPREAMIFISIHANASLSRNAEGYEVWYLPRSYRRKILDSGNDRFHPGVAPIVNALWEEEFTHESESLADMILKGFREELGPDVPNRGRREESWFVVRNARMASVLVEVGFVTNQHEILRLRRPEYLSRISRGIYNGVADFIRYFESRGN